MTTIFLYSTPIANVKKDKISKYWLNNLGSYFRIPKNWFFVKRFENNNLAYYVTKDKFDKNEQFKIGFTLKYIANCKENKLNNPYELKPSERARHVITNLSQHMHKIIVNQPYRFMDKHMYGYGITVKDDKTTTRFIFIGDNKENVCLDLLFEAPNKKYNEVKKIGNSIIESHWHNLEK